jgi:hypothetical protein
MPPESSTVALVDASPRPADVRAYNKVHSESTAPASSADALNGFAARIAGRGKTPSRDMTSGPHYSEPPRTTEEAMNEGSDDVPEPSPAPEPVAKKPEPEPEPVDDDRTGKTGQDILDEMSDLAGSAKDDTDEPAAKDEEASSEDAALDEEIKALGRLDQVRVAHREQLKQNRKLKDTLEAKTRELTELSEKLKTGTTSPEVLQELESAKERVEEYEKRLQVVDYTKSDDFKVKHVQPLENAIADAFDTVRELSIDAAEGRRAATENDFRKILSMDPMSAREAAKEMFGEFGGEVIDHYKTIRKLDKQRSEALATADVRSQEAQRQAQANQQLQQAKHMELYKSSMKEVETKYSDLFGERDGDDEVNTMVSRQRKAIEQLVSDTEMPIEERLKASAKIHQQAINYPKVLIDLKRAKEELNTLKKQLKSYESSEPRTGSRSSKAELEAEPDPLAQLALIGGRSGR